MFDEKELKEAVKYFKESDVYQSGMLHKNTIALLSLAEQVLKVEGFPEKTNQVLGFGSWKNRKLKLSEVEKTENETIDQCKLIVARDYVHKSRLLDKEDYIKILDQFVLGKQFNNDVAQSIINRQGEKMEGTKDGKNKNGRM